MVNQTIKSTTLGRKKIEIKKIDDKSSKQVTFSKRRGGIFKKASEICVLCNAQVAVIVFCPAEKVFCFGHPDAETVLNRNLNYSLESEPVKQDHPLSFEQLNKEYEEKLKVREKEKQRLTEIENAVKDGIHRSWDWWNQPIDEMNAQELEGIMEAMKEMRKNLAERADQMMRASLWPSQSFYEATPTSVAAARNYGDGLGNQFEGLSGYGCQNFGF
ncbi:Agamous-like MADS-box protein [Quillaja saponaria]|uniref:Agamous-like MADS-box protein n=1 Tax=Quillaja saponaria TaxID=32244 RepID=A0AAD7PTG0_QUISA|nr:Agamous-like MADS-box protein [Quillaja saponaria]